MLQGKHRWKALFNRRDLLRQNWISIIACCVTEYDDLGEYFALELLVRSTGKMTAFRNSVRLIVTAVTAAATR